jgi:hypothetical protein
MLPGLTVYNEPRNLGILEISKNASTRFRVLKDREGWSQRYVKDLPADCRYVAILRDPEDRYISAVNMFLRTENVLFRQPITFANYLTEDQHFITQKRHVDPVLEMGAPIDYWWFGPDLVPAINEHYNLELANLTVFLNKTNEKAITSANPDFLRKHYAEDYDLIASVKFLNK